MVLSKNQRYNSVEERAIKSFGKLVRKDPVLTAHQKTKVLPRADLPLFF